MPSSRISVLLLFIVAIAIVAAASFRVTRPSMLEPVLPRDLESLEPEVAVLIRVHSARVSEARQDAATHAELGLVYEANSLWTEARDSFAQAVRLDPDNRLWQLHLAIVTREAGDFESALSILRSLGKTHPALAPLEQRLGEALLECGELESAASAFGRLMELCPERCEGYVGLADVHLRQGNATEAASLLERAVSIDPGYRVAHYLLGTAYGRLGREEDAAHERALGVAAEVRYVPDSLTPRIQQYAVNVKSRMKEGVRLLADNKPQEAVEALEAVLRAEPRNVTAMNNLAGAYVRLGRSEQAHQLLLKARELDDRKYSTFVNLASWAVMKGSLHQALNHADEAVQLGPRIDMTHLTRSQILIRLERLDEALKSAQKAVELNQQSVRNHQLCANLCLRLGRCDEAATHYQRAVSLAPRRLDAWLGLCQANLSRRRLDEANRALIRALEIAPTDERLRLMKKRIDNARSVRP